MHNCPDCKSSLIRTLHYERIAREKWHLHAACPDCDGEFQGQVSLDQLLAIIEAQEMGMLAIMLEANQLREHSPEDHQ